MFRTNHVFPGIYHLSDAMGVSFTLIEGTEKAFLFDTGYGTENVCAFVRQLTDKPLTVYLSHGHHDHILGARWFSETYMCRNDTEEFLEKTGIVQRRKVASQARERGISLPDDYLTAVIPLPKEIHFTEHIAGFESLSVDQGEREIKIIHVPGHTPGSIMIYIQSYGLLLTGDNWNPCTWMWFPTSISAGRWRRNMTELIGTLEQSSGSSVDYVLCSHQPMIRPGSELKQFLEYMTDERLSTAPPVDMGTPADTHQIVKDDWVLVFDRSKVFP